MTKFNQSTPNKQKEVDLLRQPLRVLSCQIFSLSGSFPGWHDVRNGLYVDGKLIFCQYGNNPPNNIGSFLLYLRIHPADTVVD